MYTYSAFSPYTGKTVKREIIKTFKAYNFVSKFEKETEKKAFVLESIKLQ